MLVSTVEAERGALLLPGSHLGDVLQKIQSLFKVVLVGSSVVVTDVQLHRETQERLCL